MKDSTIEGIESSSHQAGNSGRELQAQPFRCLLEEHVGMIDTG